MFEDENKETPLPEIPEPTMILERFSSVEEIPTSSKEENNDK